MHANKYNYDDYYYNIIIIYLYTSSWNHANNSRDHGIIEYAYITSQSYESRQQLNTPVRTLVKPDLNFNVFLV